MQVQVERTDKGLMIAIPNELADGFSFGDTVEVSRENGRVVLSRPEEPPLDIEARIATITPENRHAGIKTGPPRGNEWKVGTAHLPVTALDLDAEYRQMAQDEQREAEALEWAEGTVGDVAEVRDEVEILRSRVVQG